MGRKDAIRKELKVGLFSVGLEAYWPQFPGLRERLLGYAEPRYLHVPAGVNAAGEKLSTQTGATPVDASRRCCVPLVKSPRAK